MQFSTRACLFPYCLLTSMESMAVCSHWGYYVCNDITEMKSGRPGRHRLWTPLRDQRSSERYKEWGSSHTFGVITQIIRPILKEGRGRQTKRKH